MKKNFLGLFSLLIIASLLFVGVNKVSALTSVNSVTATIVDTPTLKLSYDNSSSRSKNESLLTATFNVKVKAGNTDSKVYLDFANVELVNKTGASNQHTNTKTIAITSLPSLYKNTDQYGRKYIIVPANSEVDFKVETTRKPSELFAGSYTASLLNLVNYDDSFEYGVQQIKVSENKTNSVTIVGEKSPYIESATSTQIKCLDCDSTVTIKGVRMHNAKLATSSYLYGKVSSWIIGSDGKTIKFKTKIIGGYDIKIFDSKTGLSNNVNIKIDSTVFEPSVTIISPSKRTTVGNTFEASGSCTNYQGNVSVYYYSTRKVSVDAKCLNGKWSTDINLETNALSGTFTLYASLSTGQQATLEVPFKIKQTTSLDPSITISDASGNQGLTVNVGDKFTISGTPKNLQGLQYGYAQGNYSRAFFFDDLMFNNSCSNNEASTDGIWSMTCTAKISGVGKFYIEIYKDGKTYRSNDVVVTVNKNSNQPYATIQNSPTLKLSYDSARKESLLTAYFKVTITGGSTDTKISNPFYVNLLNTIDNVAARVNSNKTVITLNSPIKTTTDVYGVKYYIIPAGGSADFDVTFTAKPSELFAGQYFARLFGNSISKDAGIIEIRPVNNASYLQTIIGETSPYITSVTPELRVGEQIMIKGSRINENGTTDRVYIDGSVISIGGTKSDGKTYLGFILPKLSAGSHNIQISNKSGMSNRAYFIVTDINQPTISPTDVTINSGDSVKFNFTYPKNTTSAYINVICPSSVKSGSSPELCNRGYVDITSNSDFTFPLFNSSTQTQPVNVYYSVSNPYTPEDKEDNNTVMARVSVKPNIKTPSITVLSPNGGETFTKGQNIPISFSSKNLTDKLNPNGVTIQLYRAQKGSPGYISDIVKNYVGGSPYNWTVPNSLGSDLYYIYIAAPVVGISLPEAGVSDFSDDYFTISSETQNCTYTYGDWGTCIDGFQKRDYSSSPVGCTGTPIYSQSCIVTPPVVDDDIYCGSKTQSPLPAGCGSKKAQVSQAGVVLSGTDVIEVIKIANFYRSSAKWGASIVTCPANTNYRVCVENGNDGAANYILLGVKSAQLNLNSIKTVATVLESMSMEDIIQILMLLK